MPDRRPVRLVYLVSHPIQYQAPLLRRIAVEPGIDLRVVFMSDISVRAYTDPGFNVKIDWDVPLLEGYAHAFLPKKDEGSPNGFWWPRNGQIAKYLDWRNVDVLWVHGYHSATSIRAMAAARSRGIPVLARSDTQEKSVFRGGGWKGKAKDGVVSSVLRLPSAFLAVGAGNASYYRRLRVPSSRIFMLPYAVDNDRFRGQALQAAPGREEFRCELGLHEGRPVILYAGKLQTRKRACDLLAAFVELWRRGAGRRPYLVVVGDGEERPALERGIAESGLAEHIRFLGFRNQTELPRFFDLCDVFVLPSAREPYGLVLNEVMCASRALIASDEVGAAADLIRDGENGFVYPVGDVPALADRLARTLDDPAAAERMGRRSWEIVRPLDYEADIRGLKAALAYVGRPVGEAA